MASNDSTLDHPFLSYLTALLSSYQLGPDSRTPPPCDGAQRKNLSFSSQRITFPVQGVFIAQVKDAINKMVDKLDQFSKEVIRVALDVGSQGELGSQIHVPDVEGVCEMLELKETVNGMTEILSGFASEVARVTRSIGTEGRLGVQVRTNNLGGTWRYLTDSVNIMAANVRTIASAMTAVSRGDLTQKIAGLTVSGEMLELVNTINDMFVQLVIFARDIKKVTRGVGIEGMRLGVQAEPMLNSSHICNLTTQVSAMGGDSSTYITVEDRGELDSSKT
ncbi:hypothetical protein CCMSSC00406_0003104 [Pleurotus cornucopiae]|uniref:Uncharacterized protein n=1 Tax=Pleurotus cornucopiae TaxID=5321 RepID=A0ACB7J6I9_PLECO|nr:hypothetical protein CCMSSC00406_0003104 [Pleurotus cornucopiae]